MKYKLEELIELKTQGVNTTTDNIEYVLHGHKIVQAKNIQPYNITFDDKNFVSEETYKKMKYNHKLHKGDILYTNIGSQLGNSAIYNSDEEAIITWNVMKLIPKKQIITNDFLCYLLNYYKADIVSLNSSSTMPFVSGKELMNFEFEVPSLLIQNKVTKILKTIEHKIKLNAQTNDNLSEQLQLIYDEWFGKYEINNLPDGWKVEKLKNIATFSQGVQVPIDKQINEEESGYTRFIRIVDITQKNDKDIRFIEDTERGKVEENEIFMIRYGTPGILSWNYKGIIANNLFKITPKVNYLSSNFLYSYFNNNKFQRYIKGNATSSTMPAINFSTLNDRDIIIPTTDLIDKFNKISETIRLKQLSISNQNRVLSDLRDTLLPKLMNGEIDLDKIEI